MSTLQEGRWACPSCGSIVLGRYESCPSCAAPRPAGVRFFLPDDEPYVVDPNLLADAQSGVDWSCDSCGGANKGSINGARVQACVHCGEGRDHSDADETVRTLSSAPRNADEALRLEKAAKRTHAQTRKEVRSVPLSSRQPQPHSFGLITAVLLVVVVLVGLVTSLLWTYTAPATITGGAWEHTVTTEVYKRLKREGFNPPADATITRTERREERKDRILTGYSPKTSMQRVAAGVESYPCGTRDMGNGYFQAMSCTRTRYVQQPVTTQEPVYRWIPVYGDYAFYTIDRWVDDTKSTASGSLHQEPTWNIPPVNNTTAPGKRYALGAIREARRAATYTLLLDLGEDDPRVLRVNRSTYNQAREGRTSVAIRRNVWGVMTDVLMNDGTTAPAAHSAP